jgi:hypothetical protein
MQVILVFENPKGLTHKSFLLKKIIYYFSFKIIFDELFFQFDQIRNLIVKNDCWAIRYSLSMVISIENQNFILTTLADELIYRKRPPLI